MKQKSFTENNYFHVHKTLNRYFNNYACHVINIKSLRYKNNK